MKEYDRECLHYYDVSSFMCCGKLKCILCYNWHVKWVHGAEFAYDCEKGELIRTKYTFYPPVDEAPTKPGYIDPLASLTDAQLLQLEEVLKLKLSSK